MTGADIPRKNRNTVQRRIVLDAVVALRNHPTAEAVYEAVTKKYPAISRATVYRNLSLLSEQGLLRHIAVPDAADRFDHTVSPHYHIKCKKCGCIHDIPMPYLSNIDGAAGDMASFTEISHDILFYGVCPDCK